MNVRSILLVVMVFRHPVWGWTWLTEFIRERIAPNRHKQRLAEYKIYEVDIEEALARITRTPIIEVQRCLERARSFHVDPVAVEAQVRSWSGTMDLAEICYVVCRLLKPETVIETGVASGVSSSAILHALAQNESGHLYSIDMPTPKSGYYPTIGFQVATELRNRWTLELGPSLHQLPLILSKLGTVDVFLHDSRHSYHNQKMEYETVWPRLKAEGILISDDVSNDAFIELAEREGIRPIIVAQAKQFPIGLLVKPSSPAAS